MNKYDKYTPFQLPFQEMAMASTIKSKALSNIRNEVDDLEESFINLKAIPDGTNIYGENITDTTERDNLIKDWYGKVESIREKYKNDPIKSIPELRKLSKEIQTDMTYGKAAAIQNRYNQQQEDLAKAEEFSDLYTKSGGDKGTSKEQALQSFSYTANRVRPLQQNEFGKWNGYGESTYFPTMDKYKMEVANKIGEGMRANPQEIAREFGLESVEGGKFFMSTDHTIKVQPAELIEMAIKRAFMTDPVIRNYDEHINTIYDKKRKAMQYALENNSYRPGFVPDESDPSYQEYLNYENNAIAKAKGIEFRKDNESITHQWITDPEWEHNKKKEENIVPFIRTKGEALNPKTLPASVSELSGTVDSIRKENNELSNLVVSLPEGPEKERAKSHMMFNNVRLRKYSDLLAKANNYGNEVATPEEEELFVKYGNWNPSNYADPMYKKILAEMVKKNIIPGERATMGPAKTKYTTDVSEVMSYLGSKDPLEDARKLGAAYNRVNDKKDEYLKKHSDELTIQPKMISIDNTKDKSLSNTVNEIVKGAVSVTLFDSNGPVTDVANYEVYNTTEAPVDELGYLLGAREVLYDDKTGKKSYGRNLYARLNDSDLSGTIGRAILEEGKREGKAELVEIGRNMMGSQFADQIAKVREGETQKLLFTNPKTLRTTEVGTVTRSQKAGLDVWVVSVPGYEPTSFESQIAATSSLYKIFEEEKKEKNKK